MGDFKYRNIDKVKVEQLGMPLGTARNRLVKQIMFDLVKKTDNNLCHHCGLEITDIKDLSIEHKQSWLHSDDPVGLYFDLNNIAFSHTSCNYSAGSLNRQNK
jgi:hypothetical protein